MTTYELCKAIRRRIVNRAQAVKRAREDGETIILPEIPKRMAS